MRAGFRPALVAGDRSARARRARHAGRGAARNGRGVRHAGGLARRDRHHRRARLGAVRHAQAARREQRRFYRLPRRRRGDTGGLGGANADHQRAARRLPAVRSRSAAVQARRAAAAPARSRHLGRLLPTRARDPRAALGLRPGTHQLQPGLGRRGRGDRVRHALSGQQQPEALAADHQRAARSAARGRPGDLHRRLDARVGRELPGVRRGRAADRRSPRGVARLVVRHRRKLRARAHRPGRGRARDQHRRPVDRARPAPTTCGWSCGTAGVASTLPGTT